MYNILVDGTQETIASSPVGSTAKDATGPGSSSQTLPESGNNQSKCWSKATRVASFNNFLAP